MKRRYPEICHSNFLPICKSSGSQICYALDKAEIFASICPKLHSLSAMLLRPPITSPVKPFSLLSLSECLQTSRSGKYSNHRLKNACSNVNLHITAYFSFLHRRIQILSLPQSMKTLLIPTTIVLPHPLSHFRKLLKPLSPTDCICYLYA